jgi:hypothetical protein
VQAHQVGSLALRSRVSAVEPTSLVHSSLGRKASECKQDSTSTDEQGADGVAGIHDTRHGPHHAPLCCRAGVAAGVNNTRDHVEGAGHSCGVDKRPRTGCSKELRTRMLKLRLQRLVARRERSLRGARAEGAQEGLVPRASSDDARYRCQSVVA